QPLGFYAPATIVGDAQRQGVPVFPVDACRSAWECTLETLPAGDCAVQMGLRYVKGLSREEGERIEAAVCTAPVISLGDFVRRTSLNVRTLTALAEAGAFERFGLDRRTALWEVRGLARGDLEGLALPRRERTPAFAPLDLGEQIVWDYQRTAHSARGHPVQALREHLRAQGVPDARTVHALPDGHFVRYAGLVISRQRPSTAKGVVFLTLEDETGFVN